MKKDLSVVDCVRCSYERIGKPKSVLLAYSGGADSTSLLYALLKLREEEVLTLTCVHINHQIRDASIQEEERVKNHLQSLGVALLIKRVIVSREGNLEANAREARYQALYGAMKDTGSEVIALAHHANDQAETMLMRLMYGTGLAGLAGMSEMNGALWRPLLQIPKHKLITYLEGQNTQWLHDESNDNPSFMRNSIRIRLIPWIEEASPGACERMAQTAALLQDENIAWKRYEDEWLGKHAKTLPPFVFLCTGPLACESAALQRRVLRRLCQIYDIDLDFRQTEALRRLVDSAPGTALNLPGGIKAFRTKKRLHILPDAVESMHVSWPQPIVSDVTGSLGNGRQVQTFDARRLEGAIVRQAKPGDRIVPLGMTGSMTLAKYLASRGVDQPLRQFWPVLAKGREVFWAIGHGPSQTAAVTSDTEQRICLFFDARLPDE